VADAAVDGRMLHTVIVRVLMGKGMRKVPKNSPVMSSVTPTPTERTKPGMPGP
jgi:hypothetical protein